MSSQGESLNSVLLVSFSFGFLVLFLLLSSYFLFSLVSCFILKVSPSHVSFPFLVYFLIVDNILIGHYSHSLCSKALI